MRGLIALLCLLLAAMPAAAAKRVALVIANSHYKAVPALPNPPADAALVAESLRRAQFSSVTMVSDAGKPAMEAALREFGRAADGAEVALIYYAGHGIEVGGRNYLIPTDAKLAQDRDADLEAVRLDSVLDVANGAKLRLVILDACRDNPFLATMARSVRGRGIGRGLAGVEPETDTLVVYATKAGATAADGDGRNSPFATALAKRIAEPGLEISILFRKVRDDVLGATNRTQEPFTYGSLSGDAFYFIDPPAGAGVAAQRMDAAQIEALTWKGALGADTKEAFEDYLKRFPKGQFAGQAQQNLRRLTEAPKAPTAAPAVKTPAAAAGSDKTAVAYREAEELLRTHQYSFARMKLVYLIGVWPRHPLNAPARLMLGRAYLEDGKLAEACTTYRDLRQSAGAEMPADLAADLAKAEAAAKCGGS